jgi:predicted AAA+ superfamily ATPase
LILAPKEMGIIQSHLKTYLLNGGFSEVVINPSMLKNYLTTLFDSVLLKDIMKRFQILQSQQLYDVSNYFLTNYTKSYSFNQLKTDLNFSSVSTVQKLVGCLSPLNDWTKFEKQFCN